MDRLAIRTTLNRDYTSEVLTEVSQERQRQDDKFGDQTGHSDGMWLAILAEEFGEIGKALCEGADAREVLDEIIQTAAVAVAWAECLYIREDIATMQKQTPTEKDDSITRQKLQPEPPKSAPLDTLLSRVKRNLKQRETPNSRGDEDINIGRLGNVERLD